MSESVFSHYLSLSPDMLHTALNNQSSGYFLVDGLGPMAIYGQPTQGRLLFAHGAGAGQQSFFMSQFTTRLASQGIQVVGIDFPYMQQIQQTGKRRPPPPIAQLVGIFANWYTLLSSLFEGPLWVGGKSMGGRVATLFASEQSCPGVVVAGYPFHPPKASHRLRLDHWSALTCPTLILQGERDPFGTREEVEGYQLPANTQLAWLKDGDHDFKPRRSSGLSQTVLIDEATQVAASFVRAHSQGLADKSNALV